MKQNDDSIKTKKELADKDALILKLENDLNKVEEIKSTLQQNEATTKIELQVITSCDEKSMRIVLLKARHLIHLFLPMQLLLHCFIS